MLFLADVVDSSGIRVYYSDKIREHDVGMLVLGNSVAYPPLVIPPGMDRMRLDTYCGSQCSGSMVRHVTLYNYLLLF